MKPRSSDPIWLSILPQFIRSKLAGRMNLHAMIHNSGWIFFDKILRALLGFVVGAWVARYLGPSQFGELSFCIAFVAIFQSITNLGMDGIVVREIANHREQARQVLGTTFQLRMILGFICWGMAVVIYGLFNGFSGQGIWIIALVGASMVFQVADTVDLWFQGNSQSRRTVLAKASAYLIANGVKVVLILMQAPLIAFAAVVSFEGALTAIALYISYRQYPCNGIWIRCAVDAKRLLLESWPYMVSGLSVMLYMRIDQLMIGDMLGEHDLGIYAAVVPISNLWNIIPVAICTSIAPFIARKKAEGIEAFNAALIQVFRLFWIICLLIILATYFVSESLIRVMYGDAYLAAAPVLDIYVLTAIPVFLGVGQGLWLLNERKSYLSVVQTLSGAIISILTNLILLPILGLKGAAIAAVISYFISAIGINFLISRDLFRMQLGLIPRGSLH